ncbi:Sensory box histidine kinase/response regulator [Minicystis rosea]|nr:Sensory box histidine kinase/response regulator [Minicystis rosea]
MARASQFETSQAPVADAGARQDPDPSGVHRRRRLRILIIDDEPLIGAALRRALAAHEVTVVSGGVAAVGVIQEASAPFDLVLCDVMMPDLSGPGVYASVREKCPEILSRFVFITGGVIHETCRRFLASVSNPVLSKPFDLSQVRDLVRRCAEDERG